MVIRPIAGSDAELIADLHTASWRDGYRGILRDEYLDSEVVADRRAVWNERLRQPDGTHYGYIAEEEGQAVGFAYLKGAFDPVWGTLLDNLHVLPAVQGQGIGRMLIEAAARETIRRHPENRLYLWVFENNVRARGFYARLGGTEVERVLIEPPGGGTVPEVRVAWDSPAELLSGVAHV